MRTEAHLLEYWSHAATPMGRGLLTLRSRYRRGLARVAAAGSRVLKRLIDIAGAGLALLLLLPLIALVALLIKAQDGGAVFFGQRRVGLRGQAFRMWKFRSMALDAEALQPALSEQNEMPGGVIFKMKKDPRVTWTGRWIRKYSIDEVPQFWNVLVGDMALVGPRPPVPEEVEKYAVEERQRLLAKPGLTCFWQVEGRSDIDFAGQVLLDLDYIRSESLMLNLQLLARTVPAVLSAKGAY